MFYLWPVVPLCNKQLRDINKSDILNNGLYRKCDIYKGGGGYDKFEAIFQKRFDTDLSCRQQFVVQLQGCPLRCPYCYVTEKGVHGAAVYVPTEDLVQAYHNSGCEVFHLMGGSPALNLDMWPHLVSQLNGAVFHSDLLCLEQSYSPRVLATLSSQPNLLCALSIKGCSPEEFKFNTGVPFDSRLFWNNFSKLVTSHFPFYLTYTNMGKESISRFEDEIFKRYPSDCDWILADSFSIDLVFYLALVDF